MTLTTTQRQAAADTYTDNQQAIQHTAEQFARRYNLHAEDCVADANSHFLRAWQKWEALEAKPCGWDAYLRNWIWNGLLDTHRTTFRRAAKHTSPEALDTVAAVEPEPYVEDLLQQLSADGCTVLQLSLNPPGPVHTAAQAKGGEGRNYRSSLRAYLQGIGWTAARITESFAEIRQAMR